MKPIVFIHGLWLASRSWENFERYFGEKGYPTAAPEWPRKQGGVDELRRDVANLAGLGITEIVDHYDAIIRAYDEPPIIIGHSFGGLVTMLLLDRGLGAAGVAMDPAPTKGVYILPLSQLKSSSPALLHPSTRNDVVALTFAQFTYGFVNTFSEDDARQAYDLYYVPDTGRPLWEAAFGNFNPKAPNKVDYARERAPLLITAGGKDHTVPASVSRAIYKKQSASPSRTDLLELPDKPHLLTAGPGWEDTAAKIADWLATV
ncbi:MAG TPA: alpha/beta hydrolase [Gaiellaceae bacterium]|jgi:pimeloyl-ACP methyl ester carboxylesterase|nr:alpha/beta hydrolase [Gaiellaceae bacterium]